MTRMYLVRHCESEGNSLGMLQGRTDCDISGNSKKQLELVALRLRNVPFDAIYSSPLRRARKTAEAINRYHRLPITLEPGLQEIDVGVWEGKKWAEVEREYPEQVKAWNEDPAQFTPDRGETMRQVYDRIWAAVTGIVRANPGKTVCATSHGCSIRNFLCHALGKPVEELNGIGWCDNTAVSIVDFDDDMSSKVILMNDASHIPPELSVYRKPGLV